MGKTTVLIADGQTLFRSGLKELLNGYNDINVIGEAANGNDAVKMATELKPDITIMDFAMPGISGLEAAKQIKEAAPQCNILMLCAQNYDYNLPSALQVKVDGFLHKEIGTNDLLSAIRSVKAGEHVLDENAAFNILSNLVDYNSSKRISLKQLDDREIVMLKHAVKGSNNKEIAEQLGLSERKVQQSFLNIYRKLNVNSRNEATLHALKEGWISLEDEQLKL